MTAHVPQFRAYRGDEPYAFVSYSHRDAPTVLALIQDLADDGYRFWYDEGIQAGNSWTEEIAEAIDRCSLFIVFVSSVAVYRTGVLNEIDFAHKHDKQMLAIHVEPTTLPLGLELMLGRVQAIHAHALPKETVLEKARKALLLANLQPGPPRASGDADQFPELVSTEGMPPRPRAKKPLSISDAFADRVPESEALRGSVSRQLARLRGDEPIEDGVFPNVLVFHGGAGVGKTGLSRQMELWVTGQPPGNGDWGSWPHEPAIPVRWDFHESEGNLDLASLMAATRTSLSATHNSWLAFDVGLAAYLEAVRPGGTGDLGVSGKAADDILRSLQIVAAKLRLNIPQALTPSVVRQVADRAASAQRTLPELARCDTLSAVLAGCTAISPGSQGPEVAADLMYLLTQEVFFAPTPERPAMVFFLDHFEKLQRTDSISHEATIASLIASCPYGVFVITGRDKIYWADPARTDLEFAGEVAWPGLAPGATQDPRQHLLGRLSKEDTRKLYETTRATARWHLSDELINLLVERSDGLPLHIDAVLKLAQNLDRAQPGRVFVATDLEGSLPEIVKRILSVLTPDEANAFRAACVLPYFDKSLVMAVGQVSGGAFDRCLRYALVENNMDSVYPYRIHDEIRRLVRLDRHSEGFWDDVDWQTAAERGIAEARCRIGEAHSQLSDAHEMQAIALAIRLAYEWRRDAAGSYADSLSGADLARIVSEAPSMEGLPLLLPAVPESEPATEITTQIRFIHGIARPYAESVTALAPLCDSDTAVCPYAYRWRAYRLRSIGYPEEALEVLQGAIERFPDNSYNRAQYAVTLRRGRRFRDALDYAAQYRSNEMEEFTRTVERLHGILDAVPPSLKSEASKRLQLEKATVWLLRRARREGVTEEEANHFLEISLDRRSRSDQTKCLEVLGYLNLANRQPFDDLIQRLKVHQRSYDSVAGTVPLLLALRAMLTHDPADARVARDSVEEPPTRSEAWIPAEIFLEALGYPLPSVPTQWIIPLRRGSKELAGDCRWHHQAGTANKCSLTQGMLRVECLSKLTPALSERAASPLVADHNR